jgi:phosphopantothenoylcysteine decarboxylase/phosphopantothenate--cysteine ligase
MRVAVGVCGGIAVYKAAELVRLLQQHALEVEVVMTDAATEFVRPLTFAALSGHKVITGLWQDDDDNVSGPNLDAAIEHIAVAQRIQALVIAPATANMIAKLAHGAADDFLSTLALATTAPVIIAPAMNVNMWEHSATQENLTTLRARGVRVIEPGSGYLACGMTGGGRMAEPDAIAAEVVRLLGRRHDLEGQTVIITAGGTREAIDPVRYIGNRSSGKMGYALAQSAAERGAEVILISAPTALAPPPGCKLVPVITADEMRDAVLANLARASLVIKAAAVSDFRVANVSDKKIKRSAAISLDLQPTPDILAEVAELKPPGTLIVGFAAETDYAIANARAKLKSKHVDAIVLNDVSREGIGFDSDRNAVTLVTAHGEREIPEMSKREIADVLLDSFVDMLRPARATHTAGAR